MRYVDRGRVAQTLFERLGCRATRGYQCDVSLGMDILFLRHPDAQSSVWATLSNSFNLLGKAMKHLTQSDYFRGI